MKDLSKNSLSKVKIYDKRCKVPTELACKIVKTISRDDFLIKTFSKISHASIVAIHSYHRNCRMTFLFSEWMNDENLLDHIRLNGEIDEKKARYWFKQLIAGVKYLHTELKAAHCNLQCHSILLSYDNVKISGLHRLTSWDGDELKYAKLKTNLPNYYRAPEVNALRPFNLFKFDIYSLGIILFIMINAFIPFSAQSTAQLIDDQMNQRFQIRKSMLHKLSIDCHVAIYTLLEPNVHTRWSIDKIETINWLRKN
jgi:maternal embryonic leucine zipper kinase